jgi:hypothetical protein
VLPSSGYELVLADSFETILDENTYLSDIRMSHCTGDHNLNIYLPLNPISPAHSELSVQEVTIDAAVLKRVPVLLQAVVSIVGV